VNCREFFGFLDDYLTAALDATTLDTFARHIELCPPCLRYLATYRATIDIAHRAEIVEGPVESSVPEELIQAILNSRSPSPT
jgi:anti-sigma factor RsiW